MTRAAAEGTTRALVTGGGGFLGKAITRKLLERGWQVRSLNRGDYPELAALGVEQVHGDIADARVVEEAVAGREVVFHVAAKAGIWGTWQEYWSTNAEGTKNVLDACRHHRVRKLIYTSTPSVVHSGGDVEGVDESVPYAEEFDAPYPETKAFAEQIVLHSNSRSLQTVALRPHLIWGPGDTQLVPRLIARRRAGTLRLVGDGSKLIDSVYIDNAAEAHLLACDHLAHKAPCAGRAYFITQGEPLPVGELINRILAAAGLPPVERSVPPTVALAAGWAMQTVYGLLRIQSEPRMTPFLARQLSTAHWFDISAARRDLGYEPKVSIDEGLQRLAAWLAATEAQEH